MLVGVGLVWSLGMLRINTREAARPSRNPATPEVTSWVVYWDALECLQVFEEEGARLGEIALFAYHFDEWGQVVPASPWVSKAIPILKARAPERLRVLVTVVNDVVGASGGPRRLKDPDYIHRLLSTPESLAAHVDRLLEIAAETDGLQLDYENLWAEDREGFSRLVRALAARLHARGQWLSVVVQAKTDDRVRNGAGAVDWRAIAQAADRVTVMAYYYRDAHTRPGPVVPPTWVDAIVRFAFTQVPPEKLCLVLTLHGMDWGKKQKTQAVDYDAALRLAALHGVLQQHDSETGSPHFQYEAGGVRHEVWYEDEASLRKKIASLRRAGVVHLGLWHLGAGAALVRDALRALHE